MATYEPPKLNDVRPGVKGHASWKLFKFFAPLTRGRNVIVNGGTVTTGEHFSAAEMAAADHHFLGGHVYEVSGALADTLEAAGHAVENNPYLYGYGDRY